MYWEVLSHLSCSPDLAPGDVHLFGPLKESLAGKMFRAEDEVKILCNEGWKSNPKLYSKGAQ
jgi:hypothetical protein